jgi:UDP-N-acetylmuramyl-tripeptide synthetase
MKHIISLSSCYPVACHTDNVGPGSIFVAIKGLSYDGSTFIPHALQKGATTIVIEDGVQLPESITKIIVAYNAQIVRVKDARQALATFSTQAAGFPAQKLKIIGITGTKGKTTTTFLLEHILRTSGYKTALLSTVKNMILEQEFSAPLTTAQPDYLHQFLKICVQAGIDYVVMEVAAQALSLYRVEGIRFDGIIFTNFALEHLEFYKSLDEYFAAKCLIFKHCKENAPALLNADDSRVMSLCNHYKPVVSYGWSAKADVSIQDVRDSVNSLACTVSWHNGYDVKVPSLMGTFNIYNVVAALTMAIYCKVSMEQGIQAVRMFSGVPGRLERYQLPNGALCIIDYAHNPLSYEQVLSMLRQLTQHLIVVFGAGGNRDASRRPIMGSLASQYADIIILTSDNPRTEDPKKIIEDIKVGITEKHKVMCELDRENAIKKAYEKSKRGSIIVLLGKGPEQYQIIGDQKIPFSEKDIVYMLQKGE